jgi:uncharacterized protein YbjT (DUF2867 family)
MKIVVVGGTGLIGSRVVARLIEDGHEAVPASPRLGINTITGEGLTDALDGASVVVDVSNSPTFEYAAALEFFEISTRNLMAAEAAAGVGHHVALSVVGTTTLSEAGDPETTSAGYFVAKLSQERLIQASGIPYTIVHATQFFEFVEGIADASSDGGVVRLPPVLFQPMAADDIAAAVGRVAAGSPRNGIVEIAGPERLRLDEVVRRVLAAANDPREVVSDPKAGYFDISVTERMLLPGEGARLGEIRLEDWLRQSAATTVPHATAT